MFSLVRWIFRPLVLIVVSIVLVGTAALIVFRPESGPMPPLRPALRAGDQEIAWIYPATSTTSWERFVAAVKRASERLQDRCPGLQVDDRSMSATIGSTGVPEIVLRWPGRRGPRRLLFRWYKLTSAWGPEAWVKELLARRPYPLAIIGGNNSSWARELAIQLRLAGDRLPEAQRPLLLLTTATADRVKRPDWMPASPPRLNTDPSEVGLAEIYPGRTYRFCFTNRQMATAITRFLWTRADLRPDADPAYLVQWTDDPYSRDLSAGYSQVVERRASDNLFQQWGFVAGCVGLGLPPVALTGWVTSSFSHEGGAFPLRIESGIGSFDSPNPYEVDNIRLLLERFPRESAGPPRLLVVTGQAEPSRRFLRLLARSAPDLARHVLVAVGDALSFNAIYRDRMVTWPIQDLPFTLALFCHRNPIDEKAGFRPFGSKGDGARSAAVAASGTEDLLLYSDIVEAVVLACDGPVHAGVEDSAGLAAGLDALHLDGHRLVLAPRGRALFGGRQKGTRNGFTGEHVVCLRPRFDGWRVLPEATLEVWERKPDTDPDHPVWKQVGELNVSYDEYKAHQERSHD